MQGSRLTFQLASPVASDRFDPLAKTNFSLARRRHLLLYIEQRFSQTCEPNFLVLLFSPCQSVIMFWRNTINRNAPECFHSRDTKCWPEVAYDPVETWIASLAAGSLDGDRWPAENYGSETFPHLKTTKFSCQCFSQNCHQNFGNNNFHFNSIRCKHRHGCYTSIGVAQQKPKFRFPEKFSQNFATSRQKTFLSFKKIISWG